MVSLPQEAAALFPQHLITKEDSEKQSSSNQSFPKLCCCGQGGSVWGSALCGCQCSHYLSRSCISFLPCFPAALWPCPALCWVLCPALCCVMLHAVWAHLAVLRGTPSPVVSVSTVAGAANNPTCFQQHLQTGMVGSSQPSPFPSSRSACGPLQPRDPSLLHHHPPALGALLFPFPISFCCRRGS